MNRDEYIDQIYRFLTAYPFDQSKEAFILLNRERLKVKVDLVSSTKERFESLGWKELAESIVDIPEGHEWTKINDKIYVRESSAILNEVQARTSKRTAEREDAAAIASGPSGKKRTGTRTDLSMKPTDKVCPLCGEVMAWEPICPGCKLGRQGFKGRYVCMAEWDHTFYMTRDGVDLPNR